MRVDPEPTLTGPPNRAAVVVSAAHVGEDEHMDTAQPPPGAAPPPAPRGAPRPPLVRPRSGRVIGGVAIGLANHLGVPVKVVRIIFVLTSMPFAAGLTVYVFLWATMRNAAPGDPELGATTTANGSAPLSPGAVRAWIRSGNQAVLLAVLGIAVLVAAGAMWLGSAGVNVHPEVVLPVVAIGIGAVFFWSQLDDSEPGGSRRPVRWIWLVIGLCLVTLGLVGLLARGTSLGDLWQVAGAVLAALVGLAVLSAPWVLRLWSNLREEQAARIRATERADIAAHLHDSVLQTLALIQRQSHDAGMVARLARAQERQLRSYLYDEDARAGTLGAALTAALDEVEDLHGVPVELVVTGDRPMDPHLEALVKAVREAAWNAVRHASPPVTAYVEVGPKRVEAFVRDHGVGFDLDDVAADRAGVRESIIGRMERHGGTAKIRRRSDGTEIELCLPVEPLSEAPKPPQAEKKGANPEPPTAPDTEPTPTVKEHSA